MAAAASACRPSIIGMWGLSSGVSPLLDGTSASNPTVAPCNAHQGLGLGGVTVWPRPDHMPRQSNEKLRLRAIRSSVGAMRAGPL